MDGEAGRALAAERERTLARIAALTRDWEGIVESSALVASDDEHDPEGATIAFERTHVDALLRQARDHLAELDRALTRVGDGTYGVCERCGRPIPRERLAARPAAATCVRCV